MKGADKTILLILPIVALAIGFYLLVISPKQSEISTLDEEISELSTRVDTAESSVADAEQARKDFGANYTEIVSLGSAVPEDSDQATMIYDLTEKSGNAGVRFRSFELADESAATVGAEEGAATATTAPPAGEPAAPAPAQGETTTTTTTTAPTPVAPTEADAATLPIGSTVGPAGLPVMPYKLKFNGSFFDMSDFFAELDKGVEVTDEGANPKVNGRLMTINGFAMVGDPMKGFPDVQASLALNTYIVPPDQGISGGATPAGPTTGSETTVASSETTSTVPGTAVVNP